MYIVKRLKNYEISVERLKHSGAKSSIKQKIEETINLLASGKKLPNSYKDHKLTVI